MNPAAATRLEKEKHPERFCPSKGCLWRVVKNFPVRSIQDCPQHMRGYPNATTASPALTGLTEVTADRNYSGSDTSKITDAEVTK